MYSYHNGKTYNKLNNTQPASIPLLQHLQSGVLDQLEHLLARNAIRLALQHRHLLVGEPGALGQRIGRLRIAVESAGAHQIGGQLRFDHRYVDDRRIGERRVSRAQRLRIGRMLGGGFVDGEQGAQNDGDPEQPR